MKKRILVRAPALSRSGYGEHARFILRALRSREDLFDIHLHNLNWGQTGWIFGDDEERRWMDQAIFDAAECANNGGQYDISLQVTIPNEWEQLAPVNIGVTAGIETTKVAPTWIEKSILMNEIITISEHSKQTYANTTCVAKNGETGEITNDFKTLTPIEVIHYPVRDFEPESVELDLDYDFNFLTVAQISTRKNMFNTIKWFVEEFIDQEVGLVVKCTQINNSTVDFIETKKLIGDLISEYKNRKCKVYLLHGSMTDGEMTSLYQNPKIKALVSLAHGEGFGLPIFEAAYSELPIIAPDWSGHVDFLYMPVKDKKTKKEKLKAQFARVKYTLQQVQKEARWDGVIEKDSMWCYPEQGSYKMKLREVYKEYDKYKKRATKLNKWIRRNFTAKQQYKKVVDVIQKYVNTVSEDEINRMFSEINEAR
jgi:glycosyltransferase involved in cell wall biosynthesis